MMMMMMIDNTGEVKVTSYLSLDNMLQHVQVMAADLYFNSRHSVSNLGNAFIVVNFWRQTLR